MITVNPVYVSKALEPLVGGADIDEDVVKYKRFDPDSEEKVKRLAGLILFPHFQKQIPEMQQEIKNALAYYLTYPKQDFESIFNSLLLPMGTPKNSRLFFQWIWEVFFQGESKDYIKSELVVEDFDLDAPFNLLTKTGGYNTPLN